MVIVQGLASDFSVLRNADITELQLPAVLQGSNFSARGLKSAPGRSNLVTFEISLNLVRKYFAWGGGVGVTLSWYGFPPYLVFLTVTVVQRNAKNVRACGGSAPWPPCKGHLEPNWGLRRPL